MRVLYVLLFLTFCLSVSAQVIYKTTKADGTVVYSDVHTKGAQTVTLSATNSAVMPGLNKQQLKKNSTLVNQAKSKQAIEYSLSILSPAAEQTIRDNSGRVSIVAKLLPSATGKFQLMLNNQEVKTQSNGQFELENIDRGAHTIKVNFLDNSGKILASSQLQTFYLHKASALINAN